ncbi:MAG: BrnT family toxin [Planctomycetes bacterium]|nr:BrnT family toxin [Planctomycetota bacterium]
MAAFDWDDAKAASNLRKHGVSFGEAQTVFADPGAITLYDEEHSQSEDRFVTLGISTVGRLLVVAHTDDGDSIRIISARKATRKETKAYGDS